MKKFIKSILFLGAFSTYASTANEMNKLSKEEVEAISKEVASAENDIKQMESQPVSTDDKYKELKKNLQESLYNNTAVRYFQVKGKNKKNELPLLLTVRLNLQFGLDVEGKDYSTEKAVIDICSGALRHFGINANYKDIATKALSYYLRKRLLVNTKYVNIHINPLRSMIKTRSSIEYCPLFRQLEIKNRMETVRSQNNGKKGFIEKTKSFANWSKQITKIGLENFKHNAKSPVAFYSNIEYYRTATIDGKRVKIFINPFHSQKIKKDTMDIFLRIEQ